MSRLRDRISFRADGPAVGRAGVAVGEIVPRLESGEHWDALAKGLGIERADIVAAVAAEGLGDDHSLGPSLTQTAPRRPKLLGALSEPSLTSSGTKSARAPWLALAAGLLQVHDFWDESHAAAQAADDLGERDTSAYWHGIAHRREPDFGNAAYWFRRVGRHPIFDELARDARSLADADVAGRLEQAWNPTGLIELCSAARPGSREETLARRLQRAEMLRLLEASAEAAGL